MGYHQDGKLYPVNDFMKSMQQNPGLRDTILTNNGFSISTLYDIYGEGNLNKALHYKIHTLATSYIENKGNGKFELTPLDIPAQISNVNAILIQDIDLDSFKDLVLAGNLYAMEPETTRDDAGIGLWLRGDGNGYFTPVPLSESGLYIPGDVRYLEFVKTRNESLLFSAKNNDYVQSIRLIQPVD